MAIQTTKELQNFIVNQELSGEKEENIQQLIDAFSEYIVAVNPEYIYNKTYLKAYVDDFIQCQKVLKLKYQILSDKIRARISDKGIERECIINIDNVWKFENGEVKLSNTFDPDVVRKHKMQLELELIHEHGFVITEEICMDDNFDNKIDACVADFVERRKEVLGDETE